MVDYIPVPVVQVPDAQCLIYVYVWSVIYIICDICV